MRLTVFGPGHPFRGGIAQTTTALVRALDEAGHEVLFLTPKRQYPRLLYPGGTDLDPQSCPRLGVARRVLDPFAPSTWRRTRRLAEEHRADAWIIPYWTWAWAPLWSHLLGARRRPPAVAVVHNPVDHDARPWQRIAARRVLGRCRGLFTHAEALEKHLRRSFPDTPSGHHVLPSGVAGDLPERSSARAELGLPAERRVALFLGLIRPYKGVDILLEAAASLPAACDWMVVVAGEPWGDLGAALRRRASAPELSGRLRLDLGWVAEPRVPLYLSAADLVVLPYRSGSQSAVAPAALAAGRPVLSTAVGGIPEVVIDGCCGRIVPPGDAGAIAAALTALDRPTLARLADGARRRGAELGWGSYAAALVTLVAGVVSSSDEKTPAHRRGRRAR